MDPQVVSAWITSGTAFLTACISAFAALLGAVISYFFSKKNQEREIRALQARLLQEHQLEMVRLKEEQHMQFDRMDKEQQLQIERFKKEQLEQLRIGYDLKQSEANQKLWGLLLPLSDYAESSKTLIRREEKADGSRDVFLNCTLIEQFFRSFNQFFYSEHGIFLSKELRNAIFETREFISAVQKEGEAQPDGWVRISNKKAKDIEQALDWVRKNIRRDAGLENWHLPKDIVPEPK